MQPDHPDMDSQETPSPLSPLPLFGDHHTEVPKEFMDYIEAGGELGTCKIPLTAPALSKATKNLMKLFRRVLRRDKQ